MADQDGHLCYLQPIGFKMDLPQPMEAILFYIYHNPWRPS